MGIHSARKLKDNSKNNNKNQNNQNKQNNTKQSHLSGIVKEKIALVVKPPHYGRKFCVKVELKASGKEIIAFVPCDGGLNIIDIGDLVLLERKKMNDIPNCNYRCITCNGIGIKHFIEKPFRASVHV
ncbi:hypothetical protein ABK040_016006 [Willaertia magna]